MEQNTHGRTNSWKKTTLQHTERCLCCCASVGGAGLVRLQHICSARTDMGWGCGWRNLQMTTWHLLRRGGEYRQALFAGLGAPPDVASLQLWLEWAWRQGYDLEGCRQLDGRVQAVATEAGHAGEVG